MARPCSRVGISDHILTLVHDEKTVTSSLNSVRKTQPPVEDLVLDNEDDDYRGYQNVPPAPLSSVNIRARNCEENSRGGMTTARNQARRTETGRCTVQPNADTLAGAITGDGCNAEDWPDDEDDGPWRVGWKRPAPGSASEPANTSNYMTYVTNACKCVCPMECLPVAISFLRQKRPRHISEKFKTGAICGQ